MPRAGVISERDDCLAFKGLTPEKAGDRGVWINLPV